MNPEASEIQLIRHSRWSSLLIVIIGLLFTLDIQNINEIWSWLTMGIGAGLTMPLLVRWYWWRINGYGFAAGLAAGMIAAMVQKLLFSDLEEYIIFLVISGISFITTIVVAFKTPATDNKVLENFYKITRPFGFWKPVKNQLIEKLDHAAVATENKRDKIATFLAVPWQLVLFLTMMMLVIERWDYLAIFGIILFILSILLYFIWYKNLSTETRVSE
jgi:Na+/proline symporter